MDGSSVMPLAQAEPEQVSLNTAATYYKNVMGMASGEIAERWVRDMAGCGYLDRKVYKLTSNAQKKASIDDFITRTIVDYKYEFAYNKIDTDDVYYRLRGTHDPFQKADSNQKWLRDEVVRMYRLVSGKTTHTNTEATLRNVLDNITREAELGNGLWYVGDDLFWDSEAGELIPGDTLDGRDAFVEIGGTSRTEGVSTELIKETFDYWTDLLERKTEEHRYFENFYKDLPIEHDHIKTWACVETEGGVDRYWDMCISVATIFMYRQPPIVYIPKGPPRGGKSTFIKHLIFLVGAWQTSDVQMYKLADYHFNNTLYGSMLNAPDEDKSGELGDDVTSLFKSLAAKETCSLPVMYSKKPIRANLKMMMFFPRNVLPKFGTESAACMKRLRFIFCNADLSRFDRKPIDFIKVTFKDHPEYLSKYMGFILALSRYFQEHGMWYSQTMQDSSDYVSEISNSASLYYRTWKKYFRGFDSLDFLLKDYINFCRARGYDVESKINLRETFSIELQHRKKKYYAGVKKQIWMCTTDSDYNTETYKLGYKILCKDEYYANMGTGDDLIQNGGHSIVDILDDIAKDKELKFLGVDE